MIAAVIFGSIAIGSSGCRSGHLAREKYGPLSVAYIEEAHAANSRVLLLPIQTHAVSARCP